MIHSKVAKGEGKLCLFRGHNRTIVGGSCEWTPPSHNTVLWLLSPSARRYRTIVAGSCEWMLPSHNTVLWLLNPSARRYLRKLSHHPLHHRFEHFPAFGKGTLRKTVLLKFSQVNVSAVTNKTCNFPLDVAASLVKLTLRWAPQ
jgi:hypothetical protein